MTSASTAGQSWPTVSSNPHTQAFYEYMREEGQSHNMADLCAHQKPPGSCTDTSYVIGKDDTWGFNVETIPGRAMYDAYKAKAKKLGVSTGGKHYQPGLARFGGDPEAWIESKDDVKKIAQKNGWLVRQGTMDIDNRDGKTSDDEAKPTLDPNLAKFWTEQKILKNHQDKLDKGENVQITPTEYKHTFEDTHTSMSEGYNG